MSSEASHSVVATTLGTAPSYILLLLQRVVLSCGYVGEPDNPHRQGEREGAHVANNIHTLDPLGGHRLCTAII